MLPTLGLRLGQDSGFRMRRGERFGDVPQLRLASMNMS
jgi:hypothetical protein